MKPEGGEGFEARAWSSETDGQAEVDLVTLGAGGDAGTAECGLAVTTTSISLSVLSLFAIRSKYRHSF